MDWNIDYNIFCVTTIVATIFKKLLRRRKRQEVFSNHYLSICKEFVTNAAVVDIRWHVKTLKPNVSNTYVANCNKLLWMYPQHFYCRITRECVQIKFSHIIKPIKKCKSSLPNFMKTKFFKLWGKRMSNFFQKM